MKKTPVAAFILAASVLIGSVVHAADNAQNVSQLRPIYLNPAAPVEDRVRDLLNRLTQPEKLSLLVLDGDGDPLRLNTPPIPRLQVPSLRTTDAPEAVRDGPSTVFPMEITMASTWDPPLVRRLAAAIGQEAKAKNRQILYGPCVNIQRSPQGGRDFENFSEDPFLTSQMGVQYIQGIQGEGVAACVKHFICNDIESERHRVDVQVDERTLHEIYLPSFEAAARQAHAWSLMSALNKVNGVYMAQNKPLLTDLLENAWGWDGLIIGDWGALHDTSSDLMAGTSMEMPSPNVYSVSSINTALQQKTLTQPGIDENVRRVLRVMVRTGLLDGRPAPAPSDQNTPAHQQIARRVAEEGITLLKNADGLLPLDRNSLHSIAVIGPNAERTQLGGRWSADVPPFYRVSVLDGLRKQVNPGTTLSFARGCPRTDPSTPGELAAAAALAAKSDVAIVVVGTDNEYEGEELDPPNLDLPGDQDKLIEAVAAANPRTIVVLNNGTPCLMSDWLPHVRGVLEAWYCGEEGGNAVARILFGAVNPSGKLPLTIGVRRTDYSDWGWGITPGPVLTYGDGIYVGYRHFDKAHIRPLFPFGFGLSYTRFQYSALSAPAVIARGATPTVQVQIRNVGARTGDEVAQLYIQPVTPAVDRPIRELKGFARVSLRPGQAETASFHLTDHAFSYWDIHTHRWRTDPGRYVVEIGASSRDIRAQRVVRLR